MGDLVVLGCAWAMPARGGDGWLPTFAATCAKVCYGQGRRFLYCSAKFLKGTSVAFDCLSPGDR
jgi:hypothetical protein